MGRASGGDADLVANAASAAAHDVWRAPRSGTSCWRAAGVVGVGGRVRVAEGRAARAARASGRDGQPSAVSRIWAAAALRWLLLGP